MDEVFVSLDLETTGLDPLTDDIIEIGAVKFRGREVVDTFHTLVKPAVPLPRRIQILTGITPEDLAEAPQPALVLGDLLSFIAGYHIVGQNVSFDLGFLAEKGISPEGRIFDTLDLAAILLPTLSDYRLASIADALDISSTAYHRALNDARTAMEVFVTLLDKLKSLDPSIIAELERIGADVDWNLNYLLRAVKDELIEVGDFSKAGKLALPVLSRSREKSKRLAPLLVRKSLDIEQLTGMLSGDGLIAKAFPRFEHRPEQVSMMREVARLMNGGGRLVVEAGTGTGKSLAYLLPSALFALENGVPVVVSTHTISLQEQLVYKDIPALSKALKMRDLRYAQLKGRNNYLCMRRWDILRASQASSPDDARFMARLLVWLTETVSGERSEIVLRREESTLWDRVCAQSENCLGGRCLYQRQGRCFLYRARQSAEGAHLIVVNHALLLSASASDGNILPEYHHLVIDEAHRLEDVATEQWGFELGERHLSGYLNRLSEHDLVPGRIRYGGLLSGMGEHLRGSSVSQSRKQEITGLVKNAERNVERCRGRVAEFFRTLQDFLGANVDGVGEYERRLRITSVERRDSRWKKVILGAEDLCLSLEGIASCLNKLHTVLEPIDDLLEHESLLIELSSARNNAMEMINRLNSVIHGYDDEGGEKVCWLSLKVDSVTMCVAPLSVGPLLRDVLFADKEAVVLTSATLSIEGKFDYIKGQLGFEDAEELLLGSSFDYKNAALIFVPDDIPEPGQDGYQQAMAQTLIGLFRVTGGKALALFTSHASLRAVYEAIFSPLWDDDILVLGQGLDGSPRQLLEALQSRKQTVLLGTTSFWEGVDVVGEALSVLVIMRLPFSVPTDPVYVARSELFTDPFADYAVPQAVLKFKQGFGRLIRSKTDRGALVILDRRVKSKNYGHTFIESLPPCEVRSGPVRGLPEEVGQWLRGD